MVKEKLTKMQQQIDELSNLNKCLFYIETNFNNNNNSSAANNNDVASMQHELIEKLETDLRISNEKCMKLERMLDEKIRQSDQYIQLFKLYTLNLY